MAVGGEGGRSRRNLLSGARSPHTVVISTRLLHTHTHTFAADRKNSRRSLIGRLIYAGQTAAAAAYVVSSCVWRKKKKIKVVEEEEERPLQTRRTDGRTDSRRTRRGARIFI